MIYTASQSSQLPTITQVLNLVRNIVGQMPLRHSITYGGAVKDDDVFLLNRTASGLFTLKPNITMQPCLYFGDSVFHDFLQPKWNQLNHDDYLVENVLREEFELTMESHPLYSLFQKGIPTRKHIVRILNPFGNALAYGFNTPMLPLTSSLEIAAFFATHRQDNQTGAWTAIPKLDNQGKVNVGALYLLELAMPFPMMPGLSCIGMQAFLRPGRQRMFALNIGQGFNFNNHRLVYGFQFRQEPGEVRWLDDMFQNGAFLTPNELIAHKAKDIIINRYVSEQAFDRNCANNPNDDHAMNRKRLESAGVQIIKDSLHLFTAQELSETFYLTAKEDWDELFSHVVASHPGFESMLYDLRNYPNTPEGRKFFKR